MLPGQCACWPENERNFHTLLSPPPPLLFIPNPLAKQTLGRCFPGQSRDGLSGEPACGPDPGPGGRAGRGRPWLEPDGGPAGGPLLAGPGAGPWGEVGGDPPGLRLPPRY